MLVSRLRSLLALASVVACAGPALAQDEDSQVWTTLTAEIPLGEQFGLNLTNVIRVGNEAGGIRELEFGGDLEWEARDGLTFSGGYIYVPNYQDGDLTTREHRIRQQVSADLLGLAGGQLSGRLRLEQRWRDDGDDVALRLRPRLSWSRPIGPDELALIVSHESFFFLNDSDWAGEARHERMRHAVALRRELGGGFTGEIGYLNQYDFGGRAEDEVAHALTLSLTLAL